MMAVHEPALHDSDSMLPPPDDPRHSYVPFMKAPSSIASIPLTGSGGSESSGRLSSAHGVSTPGTRSSGGDLAMQSLVGLKDWELDLDALKVRMQPLLIRIAECGRIL